MGEEREACLVWVVWRLVFLVLKSPVAVGNSDAFIQSVQYCRLELSHIPLWVLKRPCQRVIALFIGGLMVLLEIPGYSRT